MPECSLAMDKTLHLIFFYKHANKQMNAQKKNQTGDTTTQHQYFGHFFFSKLNGNHSLNSDTTTVAINEKHASVFLIIPVHKETNIKTMAAAHSQRQTKWRRSALSMKSILTARHFQEISGPNHKCFQ